jgi:hypothetical protein
VSCSTLQRQNTEISKQIFPEKEYRCLSPNFHIHASVRDLYTVFPPSVCLFCWRKYVDRSWDYINRSQTNECGNWGWGRAIPRKGIHKWNFRCSAHLVRKNCSSACLVYPSKFYMGDCFLSLPIVSQNVWYRKLFSQLTYCLPERLVWETVFSAYLLSPSTFGMGNCFLRLPSVSQHILYGKMFPQLT